ncbi:Pentatricopeptide repeat-containing protein [Nymphaea thermarum]|nr:Pentatricopeptide repeat-containing protein [Nymphaea thermarum]
MLSSSFPRLLCSFPAYQLRRLSGVVSLRARPPSRRGFNRVYGLRHNGIVFWTSKISRLCREGRIEEARGLFDAIHERNVVTWNAMLSGYLRFGRISDARKLFDEMPERNVVTWTAMLSGLACFGSIESAKSIFEMMPRRNLVSWNAMISGLVRNGDLEGAQRLFEEMPERNVVTWNAMIVGYAENSQMREARKLFELMPESDTASWTSLIMGYFRIGDVDEAFRLFYQMPARTVVSWTAMISGCVANGFYGDALQLFLSMLKEEINPNEATYVCLFYACSSLNYPSLGMQVHAQLITRGLDPNDDRVSKSLIHMYSRFRLMDCALSIFSTSSKNCCISWNVLLNGYVQCGLLEKAFDLFSMMPEPDSVSWTTVISGFFTIGKVAEACALFYKMPKRDAVSWTAMISGHVQNELFPQAMNLFSQMQVEGIRPLGHTYACLLGAAGSMAELDQGKQFHARLLQTQSTVDAHLNNALVAMYAKCGAIEDSYSVFRRMLLRDIISWNSMIMGFSHNMVVDMAIHLFEAMKKEGQKPNSVTFLGILSACSHAGLLDEGRRFFKSMVEDYLIQPEVEHYICMIDLLGRAGKVIEAAEIVQSMPFVPGLAVWGALLGSCSLHKNMDIAIQAAKHVLELDPLNAPAHVLLCNMYSCSDQLEEAAKVRNSMRHKGVRKNPGCSWITVKGKTSCNQIERNK